MRTFDDWPEFPPSAVPPLHGPIKYARPREDDDEEDDDQPRKKKSVSSGGKAVGGLGIFMIIGGVVAFLSCCICVPVVIALFLPAIQKVREAAARTQSTNNLKNIGLGFHGFHDTHKRLPFNGSDQAGYKKTAVGGDARSGSWGFQILPYIEQAPLFQNPNRSVGVQIFLCPGRERPPFEVGPNGGAWTDYFINGYLNDPMKVNDPAAPDVKRTLVGITDGSSNTVIVGHGCVSTTQYRLLNGVALSTNVFDGGAQGTQRSGNQGMSNPTGPILLRDRIDLPTRGSWGGPFSQGGLMVLGDGTVRMFPYGNANFGAFLTPTGGENVLLPDF